MQVSNANWITFSFIYILFFHIPLIIEYSQVLWELKRLHSEKLLIALPEYVIPAYTCLLRVVYGLAARWYACPHRRTGIPSIYAIRLLSRVQTPYIHHATYDVRIYVNLRGLPGAQYRMRDDDTYAIMWVRGVAHCSREFLLNVLALCSSAVLARRA
jgi:hypothetical protein